MSDDTPPPRTRWLTEAQLYTRFVLLAAASWWWLPLGTAAGLTSWAYDTQHGPTEGNAAVHLGICLPAAWAAHRAGQRVRRAYDQRDLAEACPHPDHRIRHIHGDPRNQGYLAQCMECGHRFRDWPGGAHGATRCWPG